MKNRLFLSLILLLLRMFSYGQNVSYDVLKYVLTHDSTTSNRYLVDSGFTKKKIDNPKWVKSPYHLLFVKNIDTNYVEIRKKSYETIFSSYSNISFLKIKNQVKTFGFILDSAIVINGDEHLYRYHKDNL